MYSGYDWFEGVDRLIELLKTGRLSGWWKSPHGGQYLIAFENSFADYVGVKHAVAVSSGSAAIYVALRACGVGPGDRVAVSPYTHIGSVAPIVLAGAIPVFTDVDQYGNISPLDLRFGSGVKAALVAHQLGQPCYMDAHYADLVIEDASQALGAEYRGRKAGSIGDVGCFSIGGDMTKTISTGEGGMITTDNDGIADRCRRLRNHGEKDGADYLCFNFRMSDLQAAVGFAQMDKLEFQIDYQIQNAEYLISNLPDFLEVPEPPPYTKPCRYIVGCRFNSDKAGMTRDSFLEAVKKAGCEGGEPRRNIGPGYAKLIYDIPFYRRFKIIKICPRAEKLRYEAVWIDWHRYPRTREEIDELLKVLKEV